MPEHDAPWTAGPWSLGTVAIALDDGYYEAPNEAIIYCGTDAVQNENEIRVEGPDARANARLVAAAPALYEALSVLLAEARSFNVSGVYFDEPCMNHKGPALAIAALALARGETND